MIKPPCIAPAQNPAYHRAAAPAVLLTSLCLLANEDPFEAGSSPINVVQLTKVLENSSQLFLRSHPQGNYIQESAPSDVVEVAVPPDSSGVQGISFAAVVVPEEEPLRFFFRKATYWDARGYNRRHTVYPRRFHLPENACNPPVFLSHALFPLSIRQALLLPICTKRTGFPASCPDYGAL